MPYSPSGAFPIRAYLTLLVADFPCQGRNAYGVPPKAIYLYREDDILPELRIKNEKQGGCSPGEGTRKMVKAMPLVRVHGLRLRLAILIYSRKGVTNFDLA